MSCLSPSLDIIIHHLFWMLLILILMPFTDAYIIDIVIEEPITCWTCPNKTNNEECNDWAPDIHCPTNHTICKSVHIFDTYSHQSIAVHKRCAQPEECTVEMVGCHSTGSPGVQECISCCIDAYCNEMIPSNHSAAIMLSTLPNSASNIHSSPSQWHPLLILSSLLHSPSTASSRWTYLLQILILVTYFGDLPLWIT